MQLGASITCRPNLMLVERAVSAAPVSWQPSPSTIRAPGPNVRKRHGASTVAAVARRHEEMKLHPAPISILLPGQRMSPTGPCALTPAPVRTPRKRALQRSRNVPSSLPPSCMIRRLA